MQQRTARSIGGSNMSSVFLQRARTPQLYWYPMRSFEQHEEPALADLSLSSTFLWRTDTSGVRSSLELRRDAEDTNQFQRLKPSVYPALPHLCSPADLH